MALITLLTDFGLRDEYVGVMKGVIAGINPDAGIIDICHGIEPRNVVHGAFVLAAAFRYFPTGTVHVAVVDPGVGGARRILALSCDGHLFVVPDNGLIERVATTGKISEVVSVEASRYCLENVSSTFHGRDIFAPVAAHLATGLRLAELGPSVDLRSMVGGILPETCMPNTDTVEGEVVAVDRFGNLLTNITLDAIERLTGNTAEHPIVVELGGKPIGSIAASYGDVAREAPLAVVGSRGLLEVSVNCGDARRTLDAAVGDRVRIRLSRVPASQR